MNTKLITLASALVATAVITTSAQAGGGVRLGFGGPLGTFVATPSHGGGGGNAVAKSAAQKRKAAAIREASRKQEKAPARIAKVDAPAAPKAPVATATSEKETDEAPRVTGSSALIQGSIPAEEPASATSEGSPPDAKAEVSSKPAVTASVETCKKFIPAVGMTVSVGCDE